MSQKEELLKLRELVPLHLLVKIKLLQPPIPNSAKLLKDHRFVL